MTPKTKGNETNNIKPDNAIKLPDKINRECKNNTYFNESILITKYNTLYNNVISKMNSFNYSLKQSIKIYGNEYNGYQCIENKLPCVGNTPDCLYYESYNNNTYYVKNGDNLSLNMNISGYMLTENNSYIMIGVIIII